MLTTQELMEIIETLKAEKGDNLRYELKSALKGFPESAVSSISAFCNTPGGGMLILGVDEMHDFSICGVYDAKQCRQTLANYAAREFSSVVEMQSELLEIDGKTIVFATIMEAKKQVKPVEVLKTGKAYIRMYDGDFSLSDQEKQILVSERSVSRFDDEPVAGTSKADLNSDLSSLYIWKRREASRVLAGMTDDEVLLRTGVLLQTGELSIAGLLSLGIYPQQFFPNFSLRASVNKSGLTETNAIRAVNAKSFDGPIPVMLEEAQKWIASNCDEILKELKSGHIRQIREFPEIVTRELLSNALIHRDLNPYSLIQNISIKIETTPKDKRLIISNPGGLYGITIEDLGKTGSRTRNSRLAEICHYIQTENGSSIIEKLGSGIPRILSDLSELGMEKPRFIDGGLYFTVIIKSGEYSSADTKKPASRKKRNETMILEALNAGTKTRSELARATGLTDSKLRYSLKKLRDAKEIIPSGKKNDPNLRYIRIE